MFTRIGNSVAVVCFVCAATGILPSDAAADTCTWKETITYVDTDGDGNPDWAFRDTDGDGTPDKAWRDKDDDGDWDEEFEDIDDDGKWDRAKCDKNMNDKYDREWTDADGDGQVDEGEVTGITPEEDTPVGPRPTTTPEERNCCEDGGWECPDLPSVPYIHTGWVPATSTWGLIVMTLLGMIALAVLFGRRRRCAAA